MEVISKRKFVASTLYFARTREGGRYDHVYLYEAFCAGMPPIATDAAGLDVTLRKPVP
jgi:hypothetical protein